MNKLIAFVCKFWLLFIPFGISAWLFWLVPYAIDFISSCLAVIVGISLFFFWCTLVAFFIVNLLEDLWGDLYYHSRDNNWNIKVQNFLKFLKEN